MTPQNLMLLPLSTPKLSIGCPILNGCLGYETTPADLKRWYEIFFKISGTLNALANNFGVALVVTNQVVDFIGPNNGVNEVRLGNLECLHTSGRRVSPALGLAWAHCINSKVFLARHEESVGVNSCNTPSATISSQTHKTFHLVFATHLPHASAEFVIRKEGVVGVSRDPTSIFVSLFSLAFRIALAQLSSAQLLIIVVLAILYFGAAGIQALILKFPEGLSVSLIPAQKGKYQVPKQDPKYRSIVLT
ncbi:hypothetical protein L3X38_036420 [Prunus dulcis]|uniref:DNA recombination and repair protein Rad51-like C-terminal domain-containing protein n=1 Tax=Prunus dulcis TaxID=3755 RepID=A0AAD4V1M8_PRUDU|nr:hypothetical protein L3X38_036420 [Prunus dulcis]